MAAATATCLSRYAELLRQTNRKVESAKLKARAKAIMDHQAKTITFSITLPEKFSELRTFINKSITAAIAEINRKWNSRIT